MSDRRLTLRTWMWVIVGVAIVFAWIRWEGSLHAALARAAHSRIAWGLSFLTAFTVARRSGPAVRPFKMRSLLSVLRVLALAAALYLAWSHTRAWYFIFGLDRGFPFPDQAINALERWFDAQRPVSPGTVKLHGEYNTVAFVLGSLVNLFAGGAGILHGLLAKRPDGPVRESAGRFDARSPAR